MLADCAAPPAPTETRVDAAISFISVAHARQIAGRTSSSRPAAQTMPADAVFPLVSDRRLEPPGRGWLAGGAVHLEVDPGGEEHGDTVEARRAGGPFRERANHPKRRGHLDEIGLHRHGDRGVPE